MAAAAPAPTEILRTLLSAYNRHDPPEAAALYAPDGRHEDVGPGRPAHGPASIAAGLGRLLTAFPDAHWATERLIGDADGAAAAYELTGTLRADLGPFRAAGQALRLRGVLLVAVADGRIASSQDYWDSGTLARQLRVEEATA